MSSEIKADKWSPASGTSATIGDSGDTYTVPSGATLTASAATVNLPTSVITGVAEKTTLVDADKFLISDSAASGAFKHVQKSNMPSGVWEQCGAASSAAAVSTLSVTGCFTTDYISYMMTGYVKPSSNTADITFKFRTDAGTVDGSHYDCSGTGFGTNSSTRNAVNVGGSSAEFVLSAWEDDWAGGASFVLYSNLVKTKTTVDGMTIATGANWRPAVWGSFFHYDATNYYINQSIQMRYNSDVDKQTFTGIQFACSQNLEGSWVKVYGLKE
jgi:hypothetical protein